MLQDKDKPRATSGKAINWIPYSRKGVHGNGGEKNTDADGAKMASKSVKLQRPVEGHRVQSLRIRIGPPASCCHEINCNSSATFIGKTT